MAADVERWHIRGSCPGCKSVMWSDRPGKIICICSASWLEADGAFGGMAEGTTDKDMIDFVKSDMNRSVILEHVE